VLRELGIWTLLEFSIMPLPLLILGLWPVHGEIDSRSFQLLASIAGIGFSYALGIIVIPSVVVGIFRFRSSPPRRMHYVPYLATIVWLIAVAPTVGILFGVILVPQVVATVGLHVLMARHYRRNIEFFQAS
jgi:hypothetical protein